MVNEPMKSHPFKVGICLLGSLISNCPTIPELIYPVILGELIKVAGDDVPNQ